MLLCAKLYIHKNTLVLQVYYMNECIATVRVPSKLKQDAEEIIKEGYFKNFSDILVAGLRQQVQTYKPSNAVLEGRAARKAVWDYYLKKAKGNAELASKLEFADGKKIEEAEPEFFKL